MLSIVIYCLFISCILTRISLFLFSFDSDKKDNDKNNDDSAK